MFLDKLSLLMNIIRIIHGDAMYDILCERTLEERCQYLLVLKETVAVVSSEQNRCYCTGRQRRTRYVPKHINNARL